MKTYETISIQDDIWMVQAYNKQGELLYEHAQFIGHRARERAEAYRAWITTQQKYRRIWAQERKRTQRTRRTETPLQQTWLTRE